MWEAGLTGEADLKIMREKTAVHYGFCYIQENRDWHWTSLEIIRIMPVNRPNSIPGVEFSICEYCLIAQCKGTAVPRPPLSSQSQFFVLIPGLLTETHGIETAVLEFPVWATVCSLQTCRRVCLVPRMAGMMEEISAEQILFFSLLFPLRKSLIFLFHSGMGYTIL